MSYIDGYVLPLPKTNIEAYRALAQQAGAIWMEHGALSYKECLAEDMDSEWAKDSFPNAVNASESETVIFAFITFRSRQHRDEVNAKVHNDERLKNCSPESMPFDCNRMVYGGFTPLVGL